MYDIYVTLKHFYCQCQGRLLLYQTEVSPRALVVKLLLGDLPFVGMLYEYAYHM
jgi:hypothetical protein